MVLRRHLARMAGGCHSSRGVVMTEPSRSDRGVSCEWRRAEMAVCADNGTGRAEVRFLIGGRRVTPKEFEIHLDEMRRCARPIMLHTVAVASDGITAREYADHERLKLSAASERLRQAWALGLLNRTPIDRNEYRYEAVRR